MFGLATPLWAVSFGTALFLLQPTLLLAASVHETIGKAQQLLLTRQRQQAIKSLNHLRLSGTLTAAEKKEVAEALRDAGERFLTDKGQRSFELGQSQLPGQGATALKHLKEAQNLEHGNYAIEIALARTHLVLEDCTAAKAALDPLEPEVAFGSEILELELTVTWCLNEESQAEAIGRKKGAEIKLSPALLKANQAWVKWRQKDLEKSHGLLKEAIGLDSQNPAVLYWLWRVTKELERNAEPVAEAYVKRCRGRDADIRRRTFSMVEFCLRLPEVEAYLKGKGSESLDGSP